MKAIETWIWLDCDGTFVNLYGVDGWLNDLIAKNPRPYKEAQPMYNMKELITTLQDLKNKGFKIGVISWLAKNSTKKYDKEVRQTKREWLKEKGMYEVLDSIRITPYGIKKSTTCKKYGNGILVDDEAQNRNNWTLGRTIDANQNIIKELQKLL